MPEPEQLESFFEAMRQPVHSRKAPGSAPFLSVLVRTQGRRPGPLREALLCLQGQSEPSFEVLLLLHRVDEGTKGMVEALVDGFAPAFASKVRIVPVDFGGRSAPLNEGLGEATGDYVAMLDDDDLIFDHWVEAFMALAQDQPGRVLRAVCLVQDFDELGRGGRESAARASGPIIRRYGPSFDWLDHVKVNASPIHSLAYPLDRVRGSGFEFDDALSTLEDWDFLMRAALEWGVLSSSEPTGLYRLWRVGENSERAHAKAEWERNYTAVTGRIATHPFIVAAGGLPRLAALYEKRGSTAWQDVDPATQTLRNELRAIYASNSWTMSQPVRSIAKLLGKAEFVAPPVERLDKGQLLRYIDAVHASLSWRLTVPVRLLGSLKPKGKS